MSGLICAFEPCRKPVTGPARIELHRVDDETGETLPLAGVYHTRCWRAQVKRVLLLRARAADPSGYSGPAPDWREPETCDAEDLRGGVERDYRGAGTAPD